MSPVSPSDAQLVRIGPFRFRLRSCDTMAAHRYFQGFARLSVQPPSTDREELRVRDRDSDGLLVLGRDGEIVILSDPTGRMRVVCEAIEDDGDDDLSELELGEEVQL